jgi:oligopeptide transport system permease protein
MRKSGALAISFLALTCIAAIFAPWISPYTYFDQNLAERLQGPSLAHWMGTDVLGRDLFSRILYGARMSLAVGVVTAGSALFVGTFLGASAGFFRGMVDRLVLRIADLISALPSVLLAIVLMIFFGRGFTGIFAALALSAWIPQARLVRAQVLQAREFGYVEAARAIGARPLRILFRHLLPNLSGPILVSLSMQVPAAIMAESFLSFIGLGLEPPYSSWGTLANEGFRAMQSYPHLIVFPGLILFLTLLAFNALGERLRELFDPRRAPARIAVGAVALAALTGCAAGGSLHSSDAPPKQELPSIQIELTHLSRDEWQADYQLSRHVTGIVFDEDDEALHARTWRATGQGYTWQKASATCTRPEGCDHFQFRFHTVLQELSREYEFFHSFEDGARIVFLRYLRARPWLCKGAPAPNAQAGSRCLPDADSMSETMSLITRLPERIYANGISSETNRFNVRGPRRYAYFGRGRIIDQNWKDTIVDSEARVTSWIIDESMPRWIRDLVPARFPGLMGIFASEVSNQFPVTTELMMGYEHSRARSLELSANNIRGQVQATVTGVSWQRHSKDATARIVSVLVHEIAHTWSSQVAIHTRSGTSWIEEGGTDALAYAASARSGLIGAGQALELWSSSLNRCLVGLSSPAAPSLDEDPGPDGTYHPLYSCGSVLWLLIGKATDPGNAEHGILTAWNYLLHDFKDKPEVSESQVIAAFRSRGIPSRTLARIERIASGERGDRASWLVQALRDSGVRLGPVHAEPDAATRSDLAASLLAQVLPTSCSQQRAIAAGAGFQVYPSAGCPLFKKTQDIRSIEGIDLQRDAGRAYDRSQAVCTKKHRVRLKGSPAGAITSSCTKLRRKPDQFAISSL